MRINFLKKINKHVIGYVVLTIILLVGAVAYQKIKTNMDIKNARNAQPMIFKNEFLVQLSESAMLDRLTAQLHGEVSEIRPDVIIIKNGGNYWSLDLRGEEPITFLRFVSSSDGSTVSGKKPVYDVKIGDIKIGDRLVARYIWNKETNHWRLSEIGIDEPTPTKAGE